MEEGGHLAFGWKTLELASPRQERKAEEHMEAIRTPRFTERESVTHRSKSNVLHRQSNR